jgi:GTP pyrophosphokinase
LNPAGKMKTDISELNELIKDFSEQEQEHIRKLLPRSGIESPALILLRLGLDAETVIAALLLEEKEPEPYGAGVARLVEEVRKIGDVSATNKTIQEAEHVRKMLFAMASDIRVIIIKLAERLAKLQDIENFPEAERKGLAQECLDVYAPLADRLGISWLKDQLEDFSLKQINRDAYNQIKTIVAEKRDERNQFLEKVQNDIKREAENAHINTEVSSRAKHFYSIYQKMKKRNKAAGDLFDLFGIRLLCDSVESCYNLLGLVHRLWKPLEGRFKDYIAMPKSNGYQSLHTTVIVPWNTAAGNIFGSNTVGSGSDQGEGRILEIQIRSFGMHHVAENGIASHWLYKKGVFSETVRPVDISIVNRLKDWKQDSGDFNAENFWEEIKQEILKDSIYVFTPMGKVIELPSGSSPIDFAYAIHTAVGEHCSGAKSNGAIIPLGSELENTQVVEILTSPSAHPHLNWLRMVKTSKARSKIRAWLEQNDDSIIIDRNVVAKKKNAAAKTAPEPEPKPPPETQPIQRVLQPDSDAGILQVRLDSDPNPRQKNMMIRFAQCCRPVIGDAIIGYISRGRGIIIHRKNCSNIANIPDFEERKIETQWENTQALVKRFKIEAKMSADLFSEIEGAVRKRQGHLIEGRLEETAPNRLTGFFTVQLEDTADLKAVMKNIRGIPAVYSIQNLT